MSSPLDIHVPSLNSSISLNLVALAEASSLAAHSIRYLSTVGALITP